MKEDLRSHEIVFDGHVWAIVEEDLGDSVLAVDEDGGTHLLSKSRIDSVTKVASDS
jgi:hypothetical protein